jgi:hypothetical protein
MASSAHVVAGLLPSQNWSSTVDSQLTHDWLSTRPVFSLYNLGAGRIENARIRCCGNVFIELLPSNGWLLQSSCHSIFTVTIKLSGIHLKAIAHLFLYLCLSLLFLNFPHRFLLSIYIFLPAFLSFFHVCPFNFVLCLPFITSISFYSLNRIVFFSLLPLLKQKSNRMSHFNFWNSLPIFAKLGINVISLSASPMSYFMIFYNH